MLLGLITALLVMGMTVPLSKYLAKRSETPKHFLRSYLMLGFLCVAAGFVILSLFLTFNPAVYWVVGLITYGSIGRSRHKELHALPQASPQENSI